MRSPGNSTSSAVTGASIEPGIAPRPRGGIATKICGLSTAAAVRAAVAGGAEYLGFVFYPPSPRAISAAEAARLCAVTPPGVARVGLFVDADDATIEAVLSAASIDILQFHGGESPGRVAEARARFGRPVMKAVPVGGPADLPIAVRYQDVADLLLFDAKPPSRPDALPGGNGVPFEWELLAGRGWRRPWFLSGGLIAETLPQAVRSSGARAVDVSSGVERRPGVKDPDKIRAFLAAARGL
jgi:phosphoribosylanthranilate isomerase